MERDPLPHRSVPADASASATLGRPSPTAGSPSHHHLSSSPAARSFAKASTKRRPIYSCTSCKKRKVKCDRTLPCKACSLRGEADQCSYDLSVDNRHAVTQSDEIKRLRKEVASLEEARQEVVELRRRLAAAESSLATSPSSASASSHGSAGWGSSKSKHGQRPSSERPSPNHHAHLGPSVSPVSTRGSSFSSAFQSPIDIATSRVTWTQIHAMLVQRFVDRYDHRGNLDRPGEQWMTDVARFATADQSILADVLHASAMGLAGTEEGHADLQYQGQRLYTNSLNRLQVALRSSDSHRPEILYSTMLMSLYELLVLENTMSWLTHLEGVGRLIEYRGPHAHIHGLEHRTLRFFRIFGITLNVLTRKPTFLAQPDWKSIPWSVGYPGKNVLDFLLDHVVEIPGFFSLGDAIQKKRATGDLTDLPQMVQELMSGIQRFKANMGRWKEDYVATYPGLRPSTAGNEIDDDIWTRTSTVDLTLTQAMSIYYAAQLLLLRVDPQGSGYADPEVGKERLVDLICKTCEFQLTCEQDFFGALAMLFPLRVAMYTPLERAAQYQQRLAGCFHDLSSKFKVAFATTIQTSVLPSFAGRVNIERRENQPHPATVAR